MTLGHPRLRVGDEDAASSAQPAGILCPFPRRRACQRRRVDRRQRAARSREVEFDTHRVGQPLGAAPVALAHAELEAPDVRRALMRAAPPDGAGGSKRNWTPNVARDVAQRQPARGLVAAAAQRLDPGAGKRAPAASARSGRSRCPAAPYRDRCRRYGHASRSTTTSRLEWARSAGSKRIVASNRSKRPANSPPASSGMKRQLARAPDRPSRPSPPHAASCAAGPSARAASSAMRRLRGGACSRLSAGRTAACAGARCPSA